MVLGAEAYHGLILVNLKGSMQRQYYGSGQASALDILSI